MKAIQYHEQGGPEVLRWEEIADPVPAAGEVLVDVRAAAISPIHWKIASGMATVAGGSLPRIPGSEAAGVTSDGKRVVLVAGGEGVTRPGVYAEKFAAPQAQLLELPDEVSFAEAASLGVAYATAWLALTQRGQLRAGETVVVLGATGGVGVAAVQVAKMHGAGKVIAVCRASAAQAVQELGADIVLDPDPATLPQSILAASPGGAHLIIDPLAGKVGSSTLAALAPWGRQVILGTSAGANYDFPVPAFYRNNASILGFTLFGFGDQLAETMRKLLAALAEKRLHVPIDRTFPLAEAADAWRYAQTPGKLGKIILEP